MISKKCLIIAVLATFCLTAALFMIVPTRSQSGSYDARTDVNGDGTIDMADISIGIDGFMTNGDPTLNVTVKNWPTNKLAYYYADIMLPGQTEYSPWISVNEYSKIVVCIHVITSVPNEYRLVAATNALTFELYVDTQTNFGENLYKAYDTPNEKIQIRFSNQDTFERPFYATVYLIA